MIERRVLAGAAALFALSLAAWGIRSFYGQTTIAPVEGGRFTEGIVGQPAAVNPILAEAGGADEDISALVFQDIVSLAEELKAGEDKKTWTLSLKPGLRWSDGEKLTSDDIVFTVQAIQEPDTRSPLAPLLRGVSIERLSEREVRFTLKSPYAFFAENLREIYPIPRRAFGKIPLVNLRLSDYNLEPVGSGPYRFAGYRKEKSGFITEYRLVSNEFYNQGPIFPHIKEFLFRFFETYDEAIAAFNRRDIDGLGGLSYGEALSLKTAHQVLEFSLPRYYAIFMNPNASAPLKNPAVREALSLATNREMIVEKVLGGKAMPLWGPLHPAIEGYDAARYADRREDYEQARKILAGIGEKEKKRKEGSAPAEELVALEFELVVPQIPFLVETANLLKAQWAEIGVHLSLLALPPAEIAKSVIPTRNYQMLLFGNILRGTPDIFSFWHSSERFSPGLNLSLYENRELDELLEAVRTDFDAAGRASALKKVQEIIDRDTPALFLFSPSYLYAIPKNLGGIRLSFVTSPAGRFGGIEEWYRKTARVFK